MTRDRTAAAIFVAPLFVLLLLASSSMGQPTPIKLKLIAPLNFIPSTWACSPPGRTDFAFVSYLEGNVLTRELPAYTFAPSDTLSLPETCVFSEAGLLGLACHPRFDENGYIYVYYTARLPELPPSLGCSIAIVRFTCPLPSRRKPDASTRTLIYYDNPSGTTHAGGWLEFGPDGLLYCSIGDRRTPANAQNLSNPRGKVIRIDVDQDDFPQDPHRNYAIPPTNPFASGGGLGEIFLWGLRNPFRCGFDAERRLLFIGDVGEIDREEISVVPIDGPGRNLGWPCFEGSLQSTTTTDCGPTASLTFPIIEYRPRDLPPLFRHGRSVIAGGAYTGCAIPSFRHRVLLTDYTWEQGFYSFNFVNGVATDIRLHNFPELSGGITGFVRDGKGEIYITSGPGVFKIVPAIAQSADFNTDGIVNVLDLEFLLIRFGKPAGALTANAVADFNGDGRINTPDLVYFLARFGMTCP